MGDEEGPEFTPEKIAQGERITEYYRTLDTSGPTPPNEVLTHNIRKIIESARERKKNTKLVDDADALAIAEGLIAGHRPDLTPEQQYELALSLAFPVKILENHRAETAALAEEIDEIGQ